MSKTLDISDVKGARANISDIKVFGDGDTFRLICKASSDEQGWMKSTKAMEIAGVGCLVQVTTQQRNPDGSYSIAEALSFVPNAVIDVYVETGFPVLIKGK
jgi:Lon protease-like protein